MIERRLQPGPAALGEGERLTLLVSVQRHQPAAAPGRGWRLRSGGARLPYKVRCSTGSAVCTSCSSRRAKPTSAGILPEGEQRVVSGVLGRFGRDWQMVHPELIALPDAFARTGPLQPLYPLTQGLGQRRLGRCIGAALARLRNCRNGRSRPGSRGRIGRALPALCAACTSPTADDIRAESPARRRLAFDELLASQLALGLMRTREQRAAGRSIVGDGRLRRAVLRALPFRLTDAQRQAIDEIDADLARPERMLRLLQGDVGSGKTLVALLAMLAAVEPGRRPR